MLPLQALWNFCIDSPSSTEAFGEEEASELEKVLITLLDTDLDEDVNCGDEVSVYTTCGCFTADFSQHLSEN